MNEEEIHIPAEPFTIGQLAELGISRGQLRKMLADGSVRRCLRGVYAPGGLPDTPETRARCAALVLPAHSIVSDQSAAWILGVDAFEPEALDVVPSLEVVAIDGHDRTQRGELLGGKRTLQTDEIIEVAGVRVTSPLRTACDIACLRGRSRALAVLDQFCRLHGLTIAQLQATLPRYRGRRGCRQLRDLVGHADGRAESPGESWTRLAIIDAGLPVPKLQELVVLPRWGEVRLDLSYPHLKIAIEYDGEEFHGAEHREHDEARRAALARAGWFVIVVRKKDLSGRSLDRWLFDLRSELRARRASKRVYSRTAIPR
ncbi:MAG: type IV toxin-antitoxin system AbiEi family antitoxin domain-containing protein [Nocardioidaceae bacterium]